VIKAENWDKKNRGRFRGDLDEKRVNQEGGGAALKGNLTTKKRINPPGRKI